MSYTAMRLQWLRCVVDEADTRAAESFDVRMRCLAGYLIGRFA
jgi:hypothetical protein